jgi:4-amino-4-deoxy-L-arabinose transferase-like glycosyltransferase
MNIDKIKNNALLITTIALGALLLFHLFSNLIWISLDKTPLQFDPSTHTITSIKIDRCFANIMNEEIRKCLGVTTFYPPGMHILSGILLNLTGYSSDGSRILSTFYYLFFVISVYLWSSKFFENRTAGLLTAAFTSLIPGLVELSRALWQEIPLFGLIFISMYFLLKSEGFSRRRYTILAFITLGYAIFVKWMAVVYLFPPFLITYISAVKSQGFAKPTIRSVVLFVISIIPFVIWFLSNYAEFTSLASLWSQAEPGEPQVLFSIENLLYYPYFFISHSYGFILFLVTVPALVYFFIQKDSPKRVVMALLIGFPLAFFTILGNKDPRYVLFFIPLLAAIFVYAVYKGIQKTVLKTAILATVFSYLLLLYFIYSFDIPKGINIRKAVYVNKVGWVTLISLNSKFYPAIPYNTSEWPIESIMDTVNTLSSKKRIKLQTTIEYPKLNNQNLRLQALFKGYNNIVVNDDLPFSHLNGFKNEEEVIDYIKRKDYFLISSHIPSITNYGFKKALNQIQEVFYKYPNAEYFKLVKTFDIPYDEINTLMYEQYNASNGGPRYAACKKETCDKVYLYEIINPSKLDVYMQESLQFVPRICGQRLCPLSVEITPDEFVLVKGSIQKYKDTSWEMESPKGQIVLWIFRNKSQNNINISIDAWPRGNSVEYYEITGEDEKGITDYMKQLIEDNKKELSKPNYCNGTGCDKVSYGIWDCDGNSDCKLVSQDKVE